MSALLVKATLYSAVLTLCSALIATFLTPKNPPIVALVIFSIFSTPLNFSWQQYLERKLPGYRVEKHEANDQVKGGTSGGGGVTVKMRLNVVNTLIKVVIDQTLLAMVNVALHLGGVRALQGMSLQECLQAVKEVRELISSRTSRLVHGAYGSGFFARMLTDLSLSKRGHL